MYRELNYILISDGSSDKALLKVIDFCLRNHLGEVILRGERAETNRLTPRPKSLAEKIELCIDYYEPDVVFVHRDAEREPLLNRQNEISNALEELEKNHFDGKIICVIPVKMMEAWLLTNESAIRYAAGNPNGKIKLEIPEVKRIESIVNPKQKLRDLISEASELKGRRLKKLKEKLNHAVHLVAEYTEDFTKLESLTSYKHFEKQVIEHLKEKKKDLP